jgi:hypothetical protein
VTAKVIVFLTGSKMLILKFENPSNNQSKILTSRIAKKDSQPHKNDTNHYFLILLKFLKAATENFFLIRPNARAFIPARAGLASFQFLTIDLFAIQTYA